MQMTYGNWGPTIYFSLCGKKFRFFLNFGVPVQRHRWYLRISLPVLLCEGLPSGLVFILI